MKIEMREFHWDEDFETVNQFLFEAWKAGPLYRNWAPPMFENTKFGPGGTEYLDEEDEYIKIWEYQSKIVAVSIVKPSGECWIHIHPDHLASEREIVLWIEGQRKKTKKSPDDEVKYYFVVEEHDTKRISMLEEIGFEKSSIEGVSQVHPFDKPIPEYQLPEGYSVRNAVIMDEWERYRKLQMSVFTHIKDMGKNLLETYSTASFYIAELDVVAVDPDGNLAAFCTGRFDHVSKIAELEPVGTHPDHRKKGLAKAVILECLKRLQKYNPIAVIILGAAASEGANRLYESVGFENKGVRYHWIKKV